MNDMRVAIVPKSDQINADDLLAGPMTITIEAVDIRPGTEQPVSCHFVGDNGKPWKPCKSMCRVLVACWGADANLYAGRALTIFNDPKVMWGGMAVGGIRISHMSHLDQTKTMALTATKGTKKAFIVKPMANPAPTVDPRIDEPKPGTKSEDKARMAAQQWAAKLLATKTEDDLHALMADPKLVRDRDRFLEINRPDLDTLLADAAGRRYAQLTAMADDVGAAGEP